MPWFCLQGILDAYHYTISQVEFYGPTNFSSILDKTMGYATHPSQDVQHYQILLIITVSGKRCSKRICILKQGLQPMSKLFHPKIPGGRRVHYFNVPATYPTKQSCCISEADLKIGRCKAVGNGAAGKAIGLPLFHPINVT